MSGEATAGDAELLQARGDRLFADANIFGAIAAWEQALRIAEAAGCDAEELRMALRISLIRGHQRCSNWDSVLRLADSVLAGGVSDTKLLQWRCTALGRLRRYGEAEVALRLFEQRGGDAAVAARTRREWDRARGAAAKREAELAEVGAGSAGAAVVRVSDSGGGGGIAKLDAAGNGGLTPSLSGLMWQLCPFHWDANLVRLLALCNIVCSSLGIICGWWLRRRFFGRTGAAAS